MKTIKITIYTHLLCEIRDNQTDKEMTSCTSKNREHLYKVKGVWVPQFGQILVEPSCSNVWGFDKITQKMLSSQGICRLTSSNSFYLPKESVD